MTVFTRLLVAGAACLAAAIPVVLVGVFGSGGQGAIFLFTVVLLTGTGWALLPLARVARLLAQLLVALWLLLAGFLAFFGEASVRGWMLLPWAIASVLLYARPEGRAVARALWRRP